MRCHLKGSRWLDFLAILVAIAFFSCIVLAVLDVVFPLHTESLYLSLD